jgi:adenylate cyclase class IV
VSGLGEFFKIEIADANGIEVADAHHRIFEFLRLADVDEITVFSRGYLALIWNPTLDYGHKLDLRVAHPRV